VLTVVNLVRPLSRDSEYLPDFREGEPFFVVHFLYTLVVRFRHRLTIIPLRLLVYRMRCPQVALTGKYTGVYFLYRRNQHHTMTDVQKFAQDIFKMAEVYKEMNCGSQASSIFVALHSALDNAGIPKGDERAVFLGVNSK